MKRTIASHLKPSTIIGGLVAIAFLWLLGVVLWAAFVAIAMAVSGVASAAPITPAPQSVVRADLNGDGVVNGADLAMLQSAWFGMDAWADLDGDGVVNGADMAQLLSVFGAAHARHDAGDGATWAVGRDLDPQFGPSPFGPTFRRLSWATPYVQAPHWAPHQTRIVRMAIDASLIGGE